jgi:hypothetical protein
MSGQFHFSAQSCISVVFFTIFVFCEYHGFFGILSSVALVVGV